jgi:hypothetical protein
MPPCDRSRSDPRDPPAAQSLALGRPQTP